MRALRITVFTLLLVAISRSESRAGSLDNVAGNTLSSTLMLRTSNGQGTGFTVNVDGRQYLVTVRHLVTGLGSQGRVEVAKNDENGEIAWDEYTMKIFRCSGSTDIAVLIPPGLLTDADPLEPQDSFNIGQDAYFVGFPFGMYSRAKVNYRRPIPLIKHGLVSGVRYEPSDGSDLILLDGFNIFGFSGSPVTYWSPPNHSRLLAVISGFRPDYSEVLVRKEIRQQDIKREDAERGRVYEEDGHIYLLVDKKVVNKPAHEMVIVNTGIVRAYGIKAAIDLIKLHPIGPVVGPPANAK
jgi:hypothetical protein